jgi:hypothetical protein
VLALRRSKFSEVIDPKLLFELGDGVDNAEESSLAKESVFLLLKEFSEMIVLLFRDKPLKGRKDYSVFAGGVRTIHSDELIKKLSYSFFLDWIFEVFF